ncbi:MAG: serine acetyltransferase [Lentisphaeria bacterium]|nr:serine acetyltransferase [Lentisphaeria bacterium]
MQKLEQDFETNGDFIADLTARICASYADNIAVNHNERQNLPREAEILDNLNRILELIFPGFGTHAVHSTSTLPYAVGELLATTYISMRDLICRANRYVCRAAGKEICDCSGTAESAARNLLESIPELRESMKLDIQAAYDGDPAARTLDEIVLSYPGVRAISIQRIAHNLYCSKVPMIPRMMTEYAHRITGIDIHPGACLGKGLFIDHGTGVVIGETAEIGNDVKIYQGVTLGALSFPKDACGMIIKGAKRHPTIEDNVTIYAGASILGAVTIGKGSIIGGNVWLTENTAPGTKITIAAPELTIRKSSKQN